MALRPAGQLKVRQEPVAETARRVNGAVCLTLNGAALAFGPSCDDAAVDLNGTGVKAVSRERPLPIASIAPITVESSKLTGAPFSVDTAGEAV
jgi:hypothetical protein